MTIDQELQTQSSSTGNIYYNKVSKKDRMISSHVPKPQLNGNYTFENADRPERSNGFEMKIKTLEVTTGNSSSPTSSQHPAEPSPTSNPEPYITRSRTTSGLHEIVTIQEASVHEIVTIPESGINGDLTSHVPSHGNRKGSKDTIRTVGRHSTATTATGISSGMDRRGYDEAHTITIPKTYSQHDLAIASGSDRYNQQTATSKHRFSRGSSFNKSSQRRRSKTKADDRYTIMGQRVVEGHHNYIMAYNMITGIRTAVSRCSKLPGPIAQADYTKVTKLIFDMEGNTMTPSTKYEFKFKDYAPEVFRHLRNVFNIDQADYLLSLTERVSLTELGSPGKSGSFFYYSRDYRFIIKTIHHSEHRQLRRALKDYVEYVEENPGTMISQFYGLHRLKMHSRHGIQKIHFLVMNNLFPPYKQLHMKFDLKGSTQGRITDVEKEKLKGKTDLVLKDLNWLNGNYKLYLGPRKKKAVFEQLTKDIKLLEKLKIMDYSLLIGIHDLDQAAQEDPDNRLANFDPPESAQAEGSAALSDYVDADGGIRATDENDNDLPLIYYMGVIDCLTYYSAFKRSETFLRSLRHKRETISAVPAVEYGERFLKFMSEAMTIPDKKVIE
ncbi:hypothetical protein CANARDRAFT_28756 [[Candida] arabinofermentans NRRL YB-2248]|uniref:1-phosphatidylinositol-4-phosphate 5-kinase n=1 Tax=[Candida] arabinofermentans NRRL YB-2248 TaxID=983967 RepID=A0A1E4SZU6_9ASCO|nr:hypothetical protein CANARDRAFT_28756 [[Candida] arabinofermentans NRRL YB-2248]